MSSVIYRTFRHYPIIIVMIMLVFTLWMISTYQVSTEQIAVIDEFRSAQAYSKSNNHIAKSALLFTNFESYQQNLIQILNELKEIRTLANKISTTDSITQSVSTSAPLASLLHTLLYILLAITFSFFSLVLVSSVLPLLSKKPAILALTKWTKPSFMVCLISTLLSISIFTIEKLELLSGGLQLHVNTHSTETQASRFRATINTIVSKQEFTLIQTIGPFPTGKHSLSGKETSKQLNELVENIQALQGKGKIIVLILVGQSDRRALGSKLTYTYTSNENLAQARANWVNIKLQQEIKNMNQSTRDELQSLPSITLVSGASILSVPSIESTNDVHYEKDRIVRCFALWTRH